MSTNSELIAQQLMGALEAQRIWGNVVVNAVLYGADPKGERDSTTAIQLAINAASLLGGTVLFPPGRYKVTSTIRVKPYVLLKGSDTISDKDYTKGVVFNVYTGENDLNTAAFLLDISSGMAGFTFYYPKQVDPTSSTPTPYGYTIATDLTKGYNIDGVYLENIMLLNSYNGINLETGGRFNLRNIYGQPISTGLYIDRIFDVARAEHIHFWTFYASVGTNLFNWIRQNGRAFDINQCDQITGVDWFAYGYKDGFHFDDAGNGSAWASIFGATCDNTERPCYINKCNFVQFVGGSLITANLDKPSITTGTAIDGEFTFADQQYYGGNTIGAVISSTNGRVIFDNCVFKPDGISIKVIDLVVESTCRVVVNGGIIGSGYRVFGGDSLSIDGVPYLPSSTDVTPGGMMTASNWTRTGGSGSVAQITNGIQIPLSTSTFACTFPIPTGSIRQNMCVLEFDIQDSETHDHFFVMEFCRDDGLNQIAAIIGASNMSISALTHIKAPIWLGEFADSMVMRIYGFTYAGTMNVNITNMKVYAADPAKLTTRQIESVYGRIKPSAVPASQSSFPIGVELGKRIIKYSSGAAPTNGSWVVGDTVVFNPVAGAYSGKKCTVAGSPGTWKGYGLIEA
ncbi:hypothetical protein J19TS2_30920 [Cohnella xylanilytica]|uniref:glycosyl hydrolase family 28-related protein n=1 Tax=Cohnella xylanilytica TaxID=557555 RepID=UPI001B100D17|nr:glycosyl hydrolase family 28-related protein [Cohnella xylanilytica]GIO13537.1 hypothetical protein J19TS2_30920 [Cohnella xylanilytica]